jgi:hypothetical protein
VRRMEGPSLSAAPATLPDKPLRFAEFLFFSGRVSWSDCTEALSWQRAHRPMVGQIAVSFGYLTQEGVAELLRERAAMGGTWQLCDYALQRGLLTQAQVTAILGQQRRLQPRIGTWFVERGLLAALEVDDLLAALRRHNASLRNRCPR